MDKQQTPPHDAAVRRACVPEILFEPDIALVLQIPEREVRPLILAGGCGPYIILGERIAVRRLILPDRVYVDGCDTLHGAVGLPRAMLAPRFRHISDVDLRTAAAHYLYRKPV